MRSILVYADRGPAMLNRLDAALMIARAMGGHVSVLVDTPVRSYISMDAMGGSHIASEALTQALADDDTYAKAMEAQLTAEKVPFTILRSEADQVEALVRAARLADLVILSRTPDLAGEMAVKVRAPILVLPDQASVVLPPRRACIAWDGGDEAAHALRAALPLLRGCLEVDVLTVHDHGEDPDGDEAVAYLAAHGVPAQFHRLSVEGSAEQTLAQAAERLGGDLLVMGAYGHSRVHEFLFGGATRYFLENCPEQALLLAH
jgi:nucleotide-binding universal stress UspA family protein